MNDRPETDETLTRPDPAPDEITALLRAWTAGDPQAGEELFDRVYPMLGRIASRRLRAELQPASIQTTDLVHEAYVKLVGQSEVSWQCRAQFFALAARQVRRILVDHARRRGRLKRGNDALHLSLQDAARADAILATQGRSIALLDLEDALVELGEINPSAVQVVELRFFGGLSQEEAAEALGLGRATVVRKWRFARAWLSHRLQAPAR